jgi:outer membrane protein assembly factor BamD
MLAVSFLTLSAPRMRRFPVSILILFLLVLSGCASLDEDPTKGWSAQRLYTEGKTALANKEYTAAIGHFEKLEARYPYGPYAEQAMLEIAYAYYKSDEMASAIAAANRFIRTHPTHPHVDYAYYLKGLASFDEERSSLEKIFGTGDPAKRDPKALRDAYDAFKEVAQRFPKGKYAEDSRKRLISLQNAMAMSELHAANYYFSRGAYVATVNRTKNVIENYQRTPAVETALGLQALAYREMGLASLMHDTRSTALDFALCRKAYGSDSFRAGLAGADANHLFDRVDEDLAVADLAGACGSADCLDAAFQLIFFHHHLELHFRQEVHHVLGAAIELSVALLPAEALDLGHGHAGNTDLGQCLTHVVELERLDDGFDLLHGGPGKMVVVRKKLSGRGRFCK